MIWWYDDMRPVDHQCQWVWERLVTSVQLGDCPSSSPCHSTTRLLRIAKCINPNCKINLSKLHMFIQLQQGGSFWGLDGVNQIRRKTKNQMLVNDQIGSSENDIWYYLVWSVVILDMSNMTCINSWDTYNRAVDCVDILQRYFTFHHNLTLMYSQRQVVRW